MFPNWQIVFFDGNAFCKLSLTTQNYSCRTGRNFKENMEIISFSTLFSSNCKIDKFADIFSFVFVLAALRTRIIMDWDFTH